MIENHEKQASQKNNIDVPNFVMPNKRPKKKFYVLLILIGVAAFCSLLSIVVIKINSNFFEREKTSISS